MLFMQMEILTYIQTRRNNKYATLINIPKMYHTSIRLMVSMQDLSKAFLDR